MIDIVKLAVRANSDAVAAFPEHGAEITEDEFRADPALMLLITAYSRALLEEAAKVCDDKAAVHMNDPGRDDYYSCIDSRADECEQLAEAIRAMLPAPSAEQEKKV